MEERFQLDEGSKEGAMYEFFGGLSEMRIVKKNKKRLITPFAIGFLYTFKDSISIGLGVSLEDLANYKMKPYELLEKFKSHPVVKNLSQGVNLTSILHI